MAAAHLLLANVRQHVLALEPQDRYLLSSGHVAAQHGHLSGNQFDKYHKYPVFMKIL